MNGSTCIFGAIVADFIIELDELKIDPDGWQIANHSQFNPGGICITAKMAAKLGTSPKICG